MNYFPNRHDAHRMMPGPASQPALPGMVQKSAGFLPFGTEFKNPDFAHGGSRQPISVRSGLSSNRWLGRDKKRRKPIQKTECIVGNRQQVVEFGRGSRQQKCSLAGRITRGDLVELIVRQRYRAFSFRCSILCSISLRRRTPTAPPRPPNQELCYSSYSLHNQALRVAWNSIEMGSDFFFYNCGNESYL